MNPQLPPRTLGSRPLRSGSLFVIFVDLDLPELQSECNGLGFLWFLLFDESECWHFARRRSVLQARVCM